MNYKSAKLDRTILQVKFCVPVETALLLFGEDRARRTNENVVTRTSAHVIDVAPVIVVVHYLLWLLLACELGRELAGDVVAVEHECAVRLGLRT